MINGVKVKEVEGKIKEVKFILPTNYAISSELITDENIERFKSCEYKSTLYVNTAGNLQTCFIPTSGTPLFVYVSEDDKNKAILSVSLIDPESDEPISSATIGILNLKDEKEKLIFKYLVNHHNDLSNDLVAELIGIFANYYENPNGKNYSVAKLKITSESGHPLLRELATALNVKLEQSIKSSQKIKPNNKESNISLNEILKQSKVNLYKFDTVDFSEFYFPKMYTKLPQKLSYLTFHLLLLKSIEQNEMERQNEVHYSSYQYE